MRWKETVRARDKRIEKKRRGVRTDEQIDRKMRMGWRRGVDEKEERSIGAPGFLEAIITGFDAVGHQNLIKIYISF